jgi:hypothetical protein
MQRNLSGTKNCLQRESRSGGKNIEIYIWWFSMDKKEFMSYLDFPPEWLELNIYPDELFEIQKEYMLKDEYLLEKEKQGLFSSEKYGLGSEHYRYGAFWWVVKNMGYSALDKLMVVMEKEPDEMMQWATMNDLAKLKNYEECNGFSFRTV